ncbi:unnamed protein product, partial [Rotaria sp. Silwood2]
MLGMERQVTISGFHFVLFYLFELDLREMPQSLIRQPICCVQCRLAGISNVSLANLTTLSSCHQLLNYHDYEMHVIGNDLILLNHNDENINDQIINLINQ